MKQSKEFLKACKEIEKKKITPQEILEDLVFTLDQLQTIEHAQDHDKITELCKKYNQSRI